MGVCVHSLERTSAECKALVRMHFNDVRYVGFLFQFGVFHLSVRCIAIAANTHKKNVLAGEK